MELLDFPIVGLKPYHEPVTIHVFSDIHRAAAGCDAAKLRRDIKKLGQAVERGEKHYWLGGGDWSNAVGPKDKRFDQMAVAKEFHEHVGDDLFGAEARTLIREFRPIRGSCLGIGMGNHEDAIARRGEYNPSVHCAEALNVPFLGYNAIIRFRLDAKVNRQTVLMYWHHGRGAGRTIGAKANMLKGMDQVVDADIYVVGHTHEEMDFPGAVVTATRRGALRMMQRRRLYFNSGTYLKAYSDRKIPVKAGQFTQGAAPTDYAEKAGYSPSSIGHNGFVLRITKKDPPHKQWGFKAEKIQF